MSGAEGFEGARTWESGEGKAETSGDGRAESTEKVQEAADSLRSDLAENHPQEQGRGMEASVLTELLDRVVHAVETFFQNVFGDGGEKHLAAPLTAEAKETASRQGVSEEDLDDLKRQRQRVEVAATLVKDSQRGASPEVAADIVRTGADIHQDAGNRTLIIIERYVHEKEVIIIRDGDGDSDDDDSEEGGDKTEESGTENETGTDNESGTKNESGTDNEGGTANETGTRNEGGTANESGTSNESGTNNEQGTPQESGTANETGTRNETGTGEASGTSNETGTNGETGNGEAGTGEVTGSNETGNETNRGNAGNEEATSPGPVAQGERPAETPAPAPTPVPSAPRLSVNSDEDPNAVS